MAETLWRAMRLCSIDVKLGPLDAVTHDAGKQFGAKGMQTNDNLLNIYIKCVPIEMPNSMNYADRCHTTNCLLHIIVKSKAPELFPETALQISVKSETAQLALVSLFRNFSCMVLCHSLAFLPIRLLHQRTNTLSILKKPLKPCKCTLLERRSPMLYAQGMDQTCRTYT